MVAPAYADGVSRPRALVAGVRWAVYISLISIAIVLTISGLINFVVFSPREVSDGLHNQEGPETLSSVDATHMVNIIFIIFIVTIIMIMFVIIIIVIFVAITISKTIKPG